MQSLRLRCCAICLGTLEEQRVRVGRSCLAVVFFDLNSSLVSLRQKRRASSRPFTFCNERLLFNLYISVRPNCNRGQLLLPDQTRVLICILMQELGCRI